MYHILPCRGCLILRRVLRDVWYRGRILFGRFVWRGSPGQQWSLAALGGAVDYNPDMGAALETGWGGHLRFVGRLWRRNARLLATFFARFSAECQASIIPARPARRGPFDNSAMR